MLHLGAPQVGLRSPSQTHPTSALSEKAPHLRPPGAPAGVPIQSPPPAGERYNRWPAQPLARTPTSRPTNSILWHFLCRCEGPTPPRADSVRSWVLDQRQTASTISSMRSLNLVFSSQPSLMWALDESRKSQRPGPRPSQRKFASVTSLDS